MLRVTNAVALMFILAVPLHAAEEAKPNTLTPKEVEEGWILLFDGETTFGWTGKETDKWAVAEGVLYPNKGTETALVNTTVWGAFELAFQYRLEDGCNAEVVVGGENNGDVPKTGARNLLDRDGQGWVDTKIKVADGKMIATQTTAKSQRGVATRGQIDPGFIALKGTGVVFRTIRLRPLDAKPLFNGKDLTGWKKFDADPKRAKSEFSVAKEGWIHLKDGPGDLQTEKEWGDFILQIECFSNGDKLNSGVFFRCRPNEYQNGYEAQIHNGFTEKPEKDYTIEEFDPETHKLTGTKKEKFQALDYGTGGIYRRMPARRAVAKDKEWFTMTVAAQGRHIATWVNGIQVVDWIDQRPDADNARNGCKLAKGPISLQGHDATTDLRFRNINIAELPAREVKKDK
jgi:hypothetical protein